MKSPKIKAPDELEEERKLVGEVLSGNVRAFEQIVKTYQRTLYYLALRMVRNPELADDLTQKAFLKAYRALGGFQFKSSLKTWLSTIIINLCKTELMRPQREMVELEENLQTAPGEGADPNLEADDLAHRRHLLKEALDRLPERQKEVVMLRIYQELPFKEIAEALGSTETAAKVNFHHAMKSLRSWMLKKNKL